MEGGIDLVDARGGESTIVFGGYGYRWVEKVQLMQYFFSYIKFTILNFHIESVKFNTEANVLMNKHSNNLINLIKIKFE